MDEFRKQIINSYEDEELLNKDIQKGKIDYNNALGIIEENTEKKIRDAEKLEEEFYKRKNEHKPTIMRDKFFSERNGTRKLSSKCSLGFNFLNDESSKYLQPYSLRGHSKHSRNNFFNYDVDYKNENELIMLKKGHEQFVKKIIKRRSKVYADSFKTINDINYQQMIPLESGYSSLNENNLIRAIKVNEINKNYFCADSDDLLQYNVKKLRDEIKNTEDYFYMVSMKDKNKVTFLKGNIKRQTIERSNLIKSSHFSLAC